MNILITGGTGFVGRHIIADLQPDHAITVLTRNPAKAQKLFGDDVKTIEALWEIQDIGHFDTIINLAGEPIADKRWTPKQKQIICQSRWQITAELVERIRNTENPPKLLINASAVGYYGDSKGVAVTEKSNGNTNDFTYQVCAQWEQIAAKAQTQKTRVCIMRLGVVLSPEAGALKKMLLPFKLGLGAKIGDGEQVFPWVHIDDVVRVVQFFMENTHAKGIFNVTAPDSTTNGEFTERLAQSLKRPAWFSIPPAMLSFLMGESAVLLTGGQYVIPWRLGDFGFQFKYPTIIRAFRHFFGLVTEFDKQLAA